MPVVIVIPLTSQLKALTQWPHTVRIDPLPGNGLTVPSVALPFHLQAVPPAWIQGVALGHLPDSQIVLVENAMLDALGFDPPDDGA